MYSLIVVVTDESNENMFVFGGTDGSTYFSDVHQFNTVKYVDTFISIAKTEQLKSIVAFISQFSFNSDLINS
jgi:hypothetical protein